MTGQLSLAVQLPDDAEFANFHICDKNVTAVGRLRDFLDRRSGSLLIHGPRGSGKSHLLQASCQRFEMAGSGIVYLPLRGLAAHPAADLVDGLEGRALVCLDDVEAVAGSADWEEALFHLFNRCAEAQTPLLMAAALPPSGLGVRLADLGSRLRGSLIIALAELDDEARIAALVLRAQHRGMAMDPDVARLIWQRSPRDMPSLMDVLDRLDSASLEAGRRLSTGFV